MEDSESVNIQSYVTGTKTGGQGDRTAVGVDVPGLGERWLTSDAYDDLKEQGFVNVEALAEAVDAAKVWQDESGGRSEVDEQAIQAAEQGQGERQTDRESNEGR